MKELARKIIIALGDLSPTKRPRLAYAPLRTPSVPRSKK